MSGLNKNTSSLGLFLGVNKFEEKNIDCHLQQEQLEHLSFPKVLVAAYNWGLLIILSLLQPWKRCPVRPCQLFIRISRGSGLVASTFLLTFYNDIAGETQIRIGQLFFTGSRSWYLIKQSNKNYVFIFSLGDVRFVVCDFFKLILLILCCWCVIFLMPGFRSVPVHTYWVKKVDPDPKNRMLTPNSCRHWSW